MDQGRFGWVCEWLCVHVSDGLRGLLTGFCVDDIPRTLLPSLAGKARGREGGRGQRQGGMWIQKRLLAIAV